MTINVKIREAAKLSALSSGKMDENEYLTDEKHYLLIKIE